MLIDSPSEVDSSLWRYLVGLLTCASSNRNCLPRALAPVASLVPALRAHSGGAVPVFHRLPVCTKFAAIISRMWDQESSGKFGGWQSLTRNKTRRALKSSAGADSISPDVEVEFGISGWNKTDPMCRSGESYALPEES